ncbi:MAG: hypothetical protein ACK5TO_11930 [Planctomycetaceae bacterium]
MLWPSTFEELRRGSEPQQQLAPCATEVLCTCHERSTSHVMVANVCHHPSNTADWEFFWRERQTPASDHSLAATLPQDNTGVDQP